MYKLDYAKIKNDQSYREEEEKRLGRKFDQSVAKSIKAPNINAEVSYYYIDEHE